MNDHAFLNKKIEVLIIFTTPRSEASEGYVFTGVCHSFFSIEGGGGGRGGQHQRSTTSPLGTRSQHLPPPGPGHNTSLTPGTRSQHLPSPLGTRSQHLPPSLGPGHNTPPPPGPGHNTSLPPGPGHNTSPNQDQVTTPLPPPGTRSQHLPQPRPGHNTSPPPRHQVTTPPSPWDQVTTPPPPPPPLGTGHNTSPPPPLGTRCHNSSPLGPCAGGRYASYWNAFLFILAFRILYQIMRENLRNLIGQVFVCIQSTFIGTYRR